MATLIQLSYSPWSQKARWALDHHRIVYDQSEYSPMLGEPALRLRLGQMTGNVTVPALIDGTDQWTNSWEIARYAERQGRGESLRIEDQEVTAWDDSAEVLASSGRARCVARAAHNPAALLESVPPPFGKLGPIGLQLGKFGCWFLERKYQLDARTMAEHETVMRRELERARVALNGDPNGYLVGDEFSYADIAFAVSLQFVRPGAAEHCHLGPASVDAWTDPIAPDYEDLLAWRDRLYEKHGH